MVFSFEKNTFVFSFLNFDVTISGKKSTQCISYRQILPAGNTKQGKVHLPSETFSLMCETQIKSVMNVKRNNWGQLESKNPAFL